MNYSRTHSRLLVFLSLFLIYTSCNKETPVTPKIITVNTEKPDLVKDWTRLSLDLMSQCNGFNDLLSSRAMFYLSLTMYESLVPGMKDYVSLQTKISGLNTTLPQPNLSRQYNWLIVANQALAIVSEDLFKSAGSENLNKITALRDKNISAASSELNQTVIDDSKELGNQMGWKMLEYANSDGRSDYYLKIYPTITMPVREGAWVPTSPDYSDKVILPNWGETRPACAENINQIHPKEILQYSSSDQSIMYAEALEVYNLTSNLTNENIDLINYWDENADVHATPLYHNMLLLSQMLEDRDFTLDKAVELFVKMSIVHFDGYILAWQIKFKYDLLRPSSYIRQFISRFFIPEYASNTIPEYASEKALIYNASAEIFANYFGHRNSIIDFTQSKRTDLTINHKYFASFNDMAQEAAYSDLYSAVHFRTSIDAGMQLGYDLSQKTLAIKMTK